MKKENEKAKKAFYITTTLPYVNGDPHMGHALEFVRADIIARFKESQGFEVFFNTGTDEHGQKIAESAEKEGMEIQDFVDKNALRFKNILPKLGIKEDIYFIRTTDTKHEEATFEFWNRVNKNGYIYKKNYKTKYCVLCEENKTESDLLNNRCTIHPDREIEIREEENYFFKFSEFGEKILELFDSGKLRIVPKHREKEMREFIKRGLEDFSISRLKKNMSWGISVPDDSYHVMYVWFDALVNYISTLGWPRDTETFEKFWVNGTPVQYCGKDNTRFQSVMWQAMLLSADLSPTHTVVVNGFVTGGGGIKMSKSLGNVINPFDVIDEYDTDSLRYFLAREISSFEDSPFTMDRFKEAYNANLANGLGNLISRVMTMSEKHITDTPDLESFDFRAPDYTENLENFDIQKASDIVWHYISEVDRKIQEDEPFKLIKTNPEEAKKIISDLVLEIWKISNMLEPIMPETAQKIKELIRQNKSPEKPLFLRKD